MESFLILELPEAIQALVVERVAANSSFKDFFNLRVTFKEMKALTDRRSVYRFFDVLSFPWGHHMPPSLLKICYDEGNPSTLYIKGVQYFYTFNIKEYGLSLLKAAADAGYERAMYAYAMTRKIFWGDEQYFARFTRESMARVGKLIRDLKWGWGLWHGEDYRLRMDLFLMLICTLFFSCPCVPVVDIDWVVWDVSQSKGENCCDCCFWIKEVALFFRDFEPISAYTDNNFSVQ